MVARVLPQPAAAAYFALIKCVDSDRVSTHVAAWGPNTYGGSGSGGMVAATSAAGGQAAIEAAAQGPSHQFVGGGALPWPLHSLIVA